MVLYTDGISEAFNADGEQFGEQRLCECVHALPADLTAREMAERLLVALREFLGEVEPQDDMTLMVVRVLEPKAVETVRAPAPEAVAVI